MYILDDLAMDTVNQWHWNPCEFLDATKEQLKYAVIILNRPITVRRDVMASLWNRAQVRMTVDGGTKCWHEFVTAEGHASEVIDSPSPHVICGDLDSLPMEMLECYPQARVTRTPDQDETDFTKSLRVLDEYLVEKRLEVDAAVAVCDWSGRPDQVLGNVSTLLRAAGEPGAAPVFLLAESSLTWLLPAGSHVLEVPARLREGRCWCSLAPVGRPARCVSTSGLRWDLDHRELEFGKLVSTSNKFSGEPRVTVRTDSPLVWSMGLGYISD